MKALWLEDKTLDLRTIAPPVTADGDALVRVILAGVCNTDLELQRGYYPFTGIPGHEFVGLVTEGPAHLTGKRVVGEINVICHNCSACDEGRGSHCENRSVLGIRNRNGVFAEQTTLPAENLHVIPDSLPDEAAVFVEPLAAALQILEQILIDASSSVLVVGDGKLGNLVAQSLAATGCDLTVLGRHQTKLDLIEARGIKTATDPLTLDPVDIAVECSGNATGFATATACVRPRGTIVLKSTYAGDLTFDASALVVNEITLIGSRCGPFAPAIDMLAKGVVDVAPLVDAEFPLDRGVEAIGRAAEKGTMKVLIRP